jgi:tetratricopeptide (TPR) repeat protein
MTLDAPRSEHHAGFLYRLTAHGYRLSATFLFGLVLARSGSLVAADLNPPEVQGLINEALGSAYRQDYAAAREVLDSLAGEYPDNPAADFFLGAYWQLYMFDHGTDSLEPAFLDCMAQARAKAENAIASDADAEPRAHLYLGATYVYEAIYFGWKGDYWQALRRGLKASPELDVAYRADSTLDDACLGLGVSEYFHYAAGRYLVGLSLFGSLDKAIKLGRQAADGDGYLAVTARYTLAWMLTQEKHFSAANRLLDSLLAEYPGNRLFREQFRDTYLAEKDYASSISTALDLAQEFRELLPYNYAGIALNDLSLAKSLSRLDDNEAAAAWCDSVISLEPHQKSAVRLTDYVKEARALSKRLGN